MKANAHNRISNYAATAIRCKARQLAGSSGFTRDEMEDIEQELRTDLLERLPKYDPAKASRNTFVTRLIDNKISRLVRHRSTACRDYRRVECSVNDIVTDASGNKVERECTIDRDEAEMRAGKRRRPERDEVDLRHDVSLAVATLPAHLRQIADLLSKQSPAATARTLGISPSTIYCEISKMRRIFEDAGLREYLK